ncbi:MAG: methyltransferase domain-containing protein [Nitrospirales bacterium]|nr:methyltransferase domain-containing protein [Nitrospirales bacterium]
MRPNPEQFPTWDDVSDPNHSCLILFEDGKQLGPAHEPIDLVRQIGLGRYAYWDRVLYFSSSDNSNPLKNGRTYTIENSPDLYFERQVDYCLGTVRSYVTNLNTDDRVFKNQSVLEIGAGRSMGTALTMACLGAKVVVVDRYLPTWDENFHPHFFAKLKERLNTIFPWADVQQINQVVARQSFECDLVQTVHERLEDLPNQFEGNFDIHVSNACLEHLEHTEAAFQTLARSLRPGAIGAHQVDFRDHSNFSNPLGFLLLSEKAHKEKWTGKRYIHGNRMRQDQMSECLRQAGFCNFTFTTEMSADSEYLEDFLPQLRASTESPFRFYPQDQLSILSGFYQFRRED